jgi:hypothetical protein
MLMGKQNPSYRTLINLRVEDLLIFVEHGTYLLLKNLFLGDYGTAWIRRTPF